MATDLAQQLQQVAAKAGVDTKRSKGKASLLYDSRAASDIGVEQVYDIASQGLEELVDIDPQLSHFQDTVLSRATVSLDLGQHTCEENEKLDVEVGYLCRRLVPHFERKAAIAVLEYLVRQFKIHERHAQRTLAVFAPYHSTAEYARLVQISRLEGTVFKPFKGTKSTGATIPRPAVVKCCCKDYALLDTLCSAVTSGHKTGQTSPAATSFYCAIVLEVLAATPAPYPDSLIQLLLPHMVVGLAPSAATSLRLATLTIAACMMTMTSLADQVTVSLVTDACTNVTAATLRETLQFVAAACDTQRSMRGGFQGGPEGGQGGAPRSAAAALLKQPALLHEISRMQREKWRIEALIAALVACGAPASDPAGSDNTESDHTAVTLQYASVVSELQRMHDAQGLNSSTIATVQQVVLKDLPSTEYNALMAALANPVLEMLPTEEKVPRLLECLKGVSVCVMNSVLNSTGSQESSIPEGSFAAQWKWSQVRECAKQLLSMVCKGATGVSEWEKEIVVLVLPWLLARKWGSGGGIQHIVGCLQELQMWQQLAGVITFSSEPDSKAVNTAAVASVLSGAQQQPAEAADVGTKQTTPQKAKASSKRKTRSSSGATLVTPSKDDANPSVDAAAVGASNSAKKRRLSKSAGEKTGIEDDAGSSVVTSTRRALQNVQEAVAQKLLTDHNAWAAMHALQEHCHHMFPAASASSSEASRRLVTMHVLTLGVHKAWCEAWEQHQATGKAPEGSREGLGKCESWIFEAVCDIANSDLPTAPFAQVPAVQDGGNGNTAVTSSEAAAVSKEHMKLLDASAVASAVTSVRDAAFAILAAAAEPPQALALWQRGLSVKCQDLMACVLAADRSKSSFGTSFGEIAWRLMHVLQMAFEEGEGTQGTIAHSQRALALTSEGAARDAAALQPQKVVSPLSVLTTVISSPDDNSGATNPPSQQKHTSELPRKPFEIRPRAMVLLPLAVTGKFADKKLLDASRRAETLDNACANLTTTAQRVDVLVRVLCALCSQSSKLRTYACNTAAGVLMACDSADELEQGVTAISTQICASKKALEASADALQNVLSGSENTGMHGLLLHVLCPHASAVEGMSVDIAQCMGVHSVPGVASDAVRACMSALTMHGPHVLRTVFRILCHQVGEFAAAVAAHAYVPCITMHAGKLLEAGASPGGLMSLAIDILRCFQKLPGSDVGSNIPDAVLKCMAAMHETEEFTFRPGGVLRVALEARPQGAPTHVVDITTSIRRYTLESVLLPVWSALTEAELLDLMPAVLQSACSDPSAACRAAAQATLTTAPLPLASLMAPLVATSSGVAALVATEDTSLRDKLAALLASGAAPRKRRKLATDAATGASAADLPAAIVSATLVEQVLADSSEKSQTILACMGWKHDAQGRPQQALGKLMAAMHELFNDGEAESARSDVSCMHVRHKMMQKLVEESVPVLEALQSWSPPTRAQSATKHENEGAAGVQVMGALQGFVSACSHILQLVSAVDSDRARDSLNILEGSKEGAHSSELPETAAITTYATRLALTTMLRIAKLSGGGPNDELAANFSTAVPLAAFIADVLRLKEAAFGSMHLLLEVLVVALQGAAHSDIAQVLPDMMNFTVGSSRQQVALTVATGAVSAAAHAWVTTGGKAQDFFRSLVQHLGVASATHRAAFAAAAVTEMASAAKHKGVSSELSTLATILLAPHSKASKASKGKRQNAETVENYLSPDDAFSTLTTTFQLFPWQQRLAALQKLIKQSSKKMMQGSVPLAIQMLRMCLHQVRTAGSAKAADVGSAAVQKALQAILVTTMAVQAGLVEAAKLTEKADPRQTRCIKLLRTVLTALKEPLQPASLCSGLLECLSEPAQSDCATRTALRTFSSCATMMFSAHGAREAQGVAPHEAAAQFAARAAEVAATESNESGLPSADTQRAAAAAVAAAATAATEAAAAAAAPQAAGVKVAPVAATAAAGLLPCLPHLAAAATSPAGAVRVASLTAAGSVVVAAGSSAVEHIPAVTEAALKCAEGCLNQTSISAEKEEGKEPRHALELTAALETFTALLSTVPGLLFPYLQRILAVLHHPQALVAGGDAVASGVATGARHALTRHIEFRLIVPALNQTLANAEGQGTEALVATMGTLKDAVTNLSHREAVAHVDTVAEVVLKVLDVRGRACIAALEFSAAEGSTALDAQAVESATHQVMVAFILKLNENQFKKLFVELSSWARTVPSYAASTTSSYVRSAACAARRAAWFGLLSQLSLALRTVFTPYFEDLLEGFVEALRHQAEYDSVPLIGTSKERSKSKKRSSTSNTEEDREGSGSIENAALTARDRAVSCIHRFCIHDTARTLSQEKYLALLAPLVARLEECGKEATAAGRSGSGQQRGAPGGDEDLQDTVQLGTRTTAHLGGAAVGVIGAIVALAGSTKEEALWKKTNHQVLMVSRSDVPGSRLAAIECMYNLVVRLREDYLGLLPESLRFLSELLEDSDNAVLARSKDMVKLLEELSDENLDEYLKP